MDIKKVLALPGMDESILKNLVSNAAVIAQTAEKEKIQRKSEDGQEDEEGEEVVDASHVTTIVELESEELVVEDSVEGTVEGEEVQDEPVVSDEPVAETKAENASNDVDVEDTPDAVEDEGDEELEDTPIALGADELEQALSNLKTAIVEPALESLLTVMAEMDTEIKSLRAELSQTQQELVEFKAADDGGFRGLNGLLRRKSDLPQVAAMNVTAATHTEANKILLEKAAGNEETEDETITEVKMEVPEGQQFFGGYL